jgi:hypothetical protein
MMHYWDNDFDKAFDEALAELEKEQNSEAEASE